MAARPCRATLKARSTERWSPWRPSSWGWPNGRLTWPSTTQRIASSSIARSARTRPSLTAAPRCCTRPRRRGRSPTTRPGAPTRSLSPCRWPRRWPRPAPPTPPGASRPTRSRSTAASGSPGSTTSTSCSSGRRWAGGCSATHAVTATAWRRWEGSASRVESVREDLDVGGELHPATEAILDIDRLVLAVGAKEPEEHREPAQAADLLLEDRSREHDHAASDLVALTLRLLDAVDVDLDRALGAAR